MTNTQTAQIMTNKLKALDTNMLIDCITPFLKKHDEGSNFVVETGLEILEDRLPENEFVKLCEQIENI